VTCFFISPQQSKISLTSVSDVLKEKRPAVRIRGALREDVTQLLAAWGNGDKSALDKLLPLVHAELRRIARRQMSQDRDGHTLQGRSAEKEDRRAALLRRFEYRGNGRNPGRLTANSAARMAALESVAVPPHH
jgi:hypothetical protein